MNFLDRKCMLERKYCRFVSLCFSLRKELRIHFLELESFALDGYLKILFSALDSSHYTKVSMGMNGLSRCGCPEQLRNLCKSILLGFFSKC